MDRQTGGFNSVKSVVDFTKYLSLVITDWEPAIVIRCMPFPSQVQFFPLGLGLTVAVTTLLNMSQIVRSYPSHHRESPSIDMISLHSLLHLCKFSATSDLCDVGLYVIIGSTFIIQSMIHHYAPGIGYLPTSLLLP